MKTFVVLSVFLASVLAHAQVFLNCADTEGNSYRVSVEKNSPRGAGLSGLLEQVKGARVVSSRVGRLEGATVLTSQFISLSDESGRFFLVGTDSNSDGLTGFLRLEGFSSEIRCSGR